MDECVSLPMSDTESHENVLFDWYRRYIGEPDAKTDVYIGFALFFGGIGFGAVGILLFLWSTQMQIGTDIFWSFRRISVVLAALGLPALMLGIIVLLPVSRRAIIAAGFGVLICLIAMGIFASAYPSNWNVHRGADYSAMGIATYAAGLAIVTASTGAALVGHHLERAAPVVSSESVEQDQSGLEPEESYTDEEIRRDIEESMRDVEYSWGGIRKVRTSRLSVDVSNEGIDGSNFDRVSAKTSRSSSAEVEDAVAGLKQLRGGSVAEATGEGIDQQASALAQLREQQRAEELATKPDSTVEKIRSRLGEFRDRK